MHNVYNNIEEYNPSRKREVLVVFDDTIADITRNKKSNSKLLSNQIVTEIFIR